MYECSVLSIAALINLRQHSIIEGGEGHSDSRDFRKVFTYDFEVFPPPLPFIPEKKIKKTNISA